MASAAQARSGVGRAAATLLRHWRDARVATFRKANRISPRDTMFRWHEREHYAAAGESAWVCIAACLHAADKREVSRILDFGCGYGRVLRVLRRKFPEAHITASDIDRPAVDFCAATFGAQGVYSSTDPEQVGLDGRFDLIWVGSVFTHVDQPAWRRLLPRLGRALAEDGVLVLTTQGPGVAHRLRTGELDYGLAPHSTTGVVRGYERAGFGYADYTDADRHDYPKQGRYGITVVQPRMVESLATAAGLRVLHYAAAGWDDHQDVYGCGRLR